MITKHIITDPLQPMVSKFFAAFTPRLSQNALNGLWRRKRGASCLTLRLIECDARERRMITKHDTQRIAAKQDFCAVLYCVSSLHCLLGLKVGTLCLTLELIERNGIGKI